MAPPCYVTCCKPRRRVSILEADRLDVIIELKVDVELDHSDVIGDGIDIIVWMNSGFNVCFDVIW